MTTPEAEAVEVLLHEISERIRNQLDREAIKQKFGGGLSVNPHKVYVQPDTGRQALADLRRFRAAQGGRP